MREFKQLQCLRVVFLGQLLLGCLLIQPTDIKSVCDAKLFGCLMGPGRQDEMEEDVLRGQYLPALVHTCRGY